VLEAVPKEAIEKRIDEVAPEHQRKEWCCSIALLGCILQTEEINNVSKQKSASSFKVRMILSLFFKATMNGNQTAI
jgi:hypothetical protein